MSGDGGEILPFPGGGEGEGEESTLVPALEALLFAVGEPVTARALADALQVEDTRLVVEGLWALQRGLSNGQRGLELVEVAGGWQLRTDARHADAVLRLLGTRPAKLTRAALEVLSIVAYRQPATRAEIEAIRGVDSGGVVRTLIDKGVLRISGRRDEPGRPLEYRTTKAFLELFGLASLSELPTLAERAELDENE